MIGTLKVSDIYMDMLSSLPNEDKLDIISKLERMSGLVIENWK